jgi:hypothetical protein
MNGTVTLEVLRSVSLNEFCKFKSKQNISRQQAHNAKTRNETRKNKSR